MMTVPSTVRRSHDRPLERLNYFYGQMLGVRELQTEQAYFLERMRLHNRHLHGHGVVCGLEVTPTPPEEDCLPAGYEQPRPAEDPREQIAKVEAELKKAEEAGDAAAAVALKQRLESLRRAGSHGHRAEEPPRRVCVRIACGFAIDCCGREILVRRSHDVDVWALLSKEERRASSHEAATVYLRLCFCQQLVGPVRPVQPDPCAQPGECLYGYVRDAYRIEATLTKPEDDRECAPCCEPCDGDCCILLARIDNVRPGQPVSDIDIHPDVRRRFAQYDTAAVEGLSFRHGAAYTPAEARQILGRGDEGGIEIRFSKMVRAETLQPGVVDVWVIEGGPGRSAPIYNKAGELVFTPDEQGFTDRVVFRDRTREALQDQDRVILIVRSAFILDACCWPVGGSHIGGRVPLLPEYEKFDRPSPLEGCTLPPWGYAPWTSDPGVRGADFIAWFWITDVEAPKGGGKPEARVS